MQTNTLTDGSSRTNTQRSDGLVNEVVLKQKDAKAVEGDIALSSFN